MLILFLALPGCSLANSHTFLPFSVHTCKQTNRYTTMQCPLILTICLPASPINHSECFDSICISIRREVRSSRVFEDDFDPLNVAAAADEAPKATKMSKSCTASSVPDSVASASGGKAAAVDPLKRRSMPPPPKSASDGGGAEQEKTIKVG